MLTCMSTVVGVSNCWTGIWTEMVEWTMDRMDYGSFVRSGQHHFTLWSSFFRSFVLYQTSEESPLL